MLFHGLAQPVNHRSLVGCPGIEIEIQGENRRCHDKENLARFGAKSVLKGEQRETGNGNRNRQPCARRLGFLEHQACDNRHYYDTQAGQKGALTQTGYMNQSHYPAGHGRAKHQPDTHTSAKLIDAQFHQRATGEKGEHGAGNQKPGRHEHQGRHQQYSLLGKHPADGCKQGDNNQ